MRINWGTGIVIGMIVFMTFILVLVITMMTNKGFDHDMVTEGYYEKDLVYQDEINAEKNAQALSSAIWVKKGEDGWRFYFPKELRENAISGTVELYRPSNQQLDFQLPLIVQDSTMLIPAGRLLDGQWKVTIQWEMNGKKYLYKKQMQY